MRPFAVLFVFIAAGLASGCDGGTGFRIDPLLATDTVELAAPSADSELPTALDVTAVAGIIRGGRFPERQEDAEEWDIAIRIRDGQLVFLPAGALGLNSRAGITPPLNGQTFESVIEAPGRGAFVTDSAVVVQQGAVYVVRSRAVPCGFGADAQYAKIQPISVVPEEGRLTIQVVTNERCGDPRLVPDD